MADKPVQVMVVDDEPSIQRFLGTSLTAHGYQVTGASSGREALDVLATETPDLIILDLGLPDMNGLDLVKLFRERCEAPIIILSVREHEADKVTALDEGADDYVTKPFGLSELLARMRVTLRRTGAARSVTVFALDELLVDLGQRTVHVAGAK